MRAERAVTLEYGAEWARHAAAHLATGAAPTMTESRAIVAMSARVDAARAAVDALLRGAPADVVAGDVVRRYLAAQSTATQRGATNADVDDQRAARAALDAALAAAGGGR